MARRPAGMTFEFAGLRFGWDPDKDAVNVAKHDVDFATAARAFSEPMVRRPDDRRDYGEKRWIALAVIDGIVIVIVYTVRSKRIRIISARKANRNEKKTYEQAIEKHYRRQNSEG